MPSRRRSKKARILDRLGDRSIILVGMMGCGKSAIGKMLARKLELEFKDADEEIELAAGRSVADIFKEYGEPEFRRLEERVISRLMTEGPMVLALGGGAFLNDETRGAILEHGLSINQFHCAGLLSLLKLQRQLFQNFQQLKARGQKFLCDQIFSDY